VDPGRVSRQSATAIRTVDLDAGVVAVLKRQRDTQRFESRREDYQVTDYVFTKPAGGHYHPQVISKMLARSSEEVFAMRRRVLVMVTASRGFVETDR
jgi:hypothetical protein